MAEVSSRAGLRALAIAAVIVGCFAYPFDKSNGFGPPWKLEVSKPLAIVSSFGGLRPQRFRDLRIGRGHQVGLTERFEPNLMRASACWVVMDSTMPYTRLMIGAKRNTVPHRHQWVGAGKPQNRAKPMRCVGCTETYYKAV